MNQYKPVVLLAEDNPAEQNLARRAFQRAEVNCELYIVSDGEEALQYLTRQGLYCNSQDSPVPDLLLLDLNMPRLDGRRLLAQIKQDSGLRSIPVVVFTTSDADQDVSRSYELGCNSFIQKPFEMHKFITALEKLRDYWMSLVTLPPKNHNTVRQPVKHPTGF